MDTARISGGGLPPVEVSANNAADPNPQFGMFEFDPSITDQSRWTSYTQAGGHP